MADLHKFTDDIRDAGSKSKPIKAAKLDENFKVVRLRIGTNLEGLFKITPDFPNGDILDVATGSNGDILIYNNGWTVLPNPGDGEWVFVHDGTLPSWKLLTPC